LIATPRGRSRSLTSLRVQARPLRGLDPLAFELVADRRHRQPLPVQGEDRVVAKGVRVGQQQLVACVALDGRGAPGVRAARR
jgi:hypothetical protein